MHFKSAVYITLILEELQEGRGRNGKDNAVDDSEAKFTNDLYTLFIGWPGTTALKSLCCHVLAALL